MAFRSANNWKQNKENEIEKNVSLILRSTKNSLLVCFFCRMRVCVCAWVLSFDLSAFSVCLRIGERHRFHLTHFPRPPNSDCRTRHNAIPFFFCFTGGKLFHAFADSAVTESRYLRISWWICVYGTYIYSMYLPGLLAHLVNNLRCAQQYSRHVNKWKCEWECDISIRTTWHPLDTPNKVSTECQTRYLRNASEVVCQREGWIGFWQKCLHILSAQIHFNYHNILQINISVSFHIKIIYFIYIFYYILFSFHLTDQLDKCSHT